MAVLHVSSRPPGNTQTPATVPLHARVSAQVVAESQGSPTAVAVAITILHQKLNPASRAASASARTRP